MKALVLGKEGQLGRAFLKQMKAQGLGRQEVDLSKGAEGVKLLDTLNFDLLINAAAFTDTEKAEKYPEKAWQVNAMSLTHLVEVVAKKKAIFVHIGSDYVFSGDKKAPYKEEDPIGPLSAYGASKAAGEYIALQYPKTYVFRTASLFGMGGQNIVETFLRLGKNKEKISAISDHWMSPTYAQNLVDWTLLALAKQVPFGLYHAVNTGGATWHEFAQEIFAKCGIRCDVQACSFREYPSSIQRPQYSVLDTRKLQTVVGSLPSWQEGLAAYLKERCG